VSRPPLPGGPFLVVGLARSGVAAGLALLARGEVVLGTDRDPARGGELAAAGAEIVSDGVAALDRARCVVKSPGVPAQEPVIARARERGIAVLGELELAWRMLGNDLVAVTGTNGKTTTVELIGAIHRAAGLPVVVAGNVGLALSRLAAPPPFGDGPLDPATVIVCEVSSFQLEDAVALAPQAAVLLNIAPDHLDRHGDIEAYVAAKLRLFAWQGPRELAVLPASGPAEVPGRAARLTFGAAPDADLRLEGETLWWRGGRLAAASDVRLRGAHNLENAMAAAAATLGRGLPREAVAAALASFAGVAHRLEEVAQAGGVLYINDSKATNVASALVALRSFAPGSVHVILGGRGGGQDYAPLREEVARRARAAYLIGEQAEAIARALAGLPLVACGTLERAVEAARAAAAPGEVVLLSPACKSFDQFRDFETRGEAFRALAAAVGNRAS
jgi:UDP-N-acetylmuramoylalanine--D-glutamate ligase